MTIKMHYVRGPRSVIFAAGISVALAACGTTAPLQSQRQLAGGARGLGGGLSGVPGSGGSGNGGPGGGSSSNARATMSWNSRRVILTGTAPAKPLMPLLVL